MYQQMQAIQDEETRRTTIENGVSRDPVLAAVHASATLRPLAREQLAFLGPSPHDYFRAARARKQKEATARNRLNKRKRDADDDAREGRRDQRP